MKLYERIIFSMVISVVIFAIWRFGLWFDLLWTQRTELYIQVHKTLSFVGAAILGTIIAFSVD